MKTTAFKNTDIGPIPEDWGTSPIGVICDIQLGKMLDEEKNIGEPKPYLGNRAVQWNRIVLDGISTIRLTPEEQKRYLLQDGDLLVCEGGEVGRSAIWRTDLPECYYQKALHRLRSKNGNTICIEFLLQLFHLYSTSGIFESSVTKTSIAHLPKDKLENILVPLPPLPEQRRIAAALSDADELVASLDKLIEKKKRVKEGAMQRLLSGETRLPGFTGKWVEKKLGECSSIARGGSPRPIEMYLTTDPTGVNWIKIGDVGDDAKYIESTSERIVPEGASHSRLVASGDLILSNSMSYGRPYILKIDGCIHDGWLVIQKYSDTFDTEFLYYGLRTSAVTNQYQALAAGSSVHNLNKELVGNVVVLTPPTLAEQRAIAAVLSDMDAEIAALSRERAEAARIKQGMMQELLTGKTRLVKGE